MTRTLTRNIRKSRWTPNSMRASLDSSPATLSPSIPKAGSGTPWSVQCTRLTKDQVIVFCATSVGLLRRFSGLLRGELRPRLVFHSALHDLGMGRVLGLDLASLSYDDTMVMAWLLQLEPQGLKMLAARHCGMQMHSYDDLLGDKANELARDYLTWLWDEEEVSYAERQHEAFKAAIDAGRRVRVLLKLPRIQTYRSPAAASSSPKTPPASGPTNSRSIRLPGFIDWDPSQRRLSITLSEGRAVHYGCRDADATLRVATELRRRIDAMGLSGVYSLELGTYPLIDRMQRIGLKPDLEHFARLSERLAYRDWQTPTILAQAKRTGITDFNANSGDQVAALTLRQPAASRKSSGPRARTRGSAVARRTTKTSRGPRT